MSLATMKYRLNDRRLLVCGYALSDDTIRLGLIVSFNSWVLWLQNRRRWLTAQRHKKLGWLHLRLAILFRAWRVAAGRKGLLRNDEPNCEYMDFINSDTLPLSEQLIASSGSIDKSYPSHCISQRDMRSLCQCVALSGDTHKHDAPLRATLDSAVVDSNLNVAVECIAAGCPVTLSNIQDALSSIKTDHATLFSILLSNCPLYCAKLVSGGEDCIQQELNKCISPLIVVMLKTHIDRWTRADISFREVTTLVADAESVMQSMTLGVSLWRDVVRMTLDRAKLIKTSSEPVPKPTWRSFFGEKMNNFRHPLLQHAYKTMPTAEIHNKLESIEALILSMHEASHQQRSEMKAHDLYLLKKASTRECHKSFVKLKRLVATERGELTAELSQAFDAEIQSVYNGERPMEERLTMACEDNEERMSNNFSSMLMETWWSADYLSASSSSVVTIRAHDLEYKSKLKILSAQRLLVKLVDILCRQSVLKNSSIAENANTMGSGAVATLIICAVLQNLKEFSRPSSNQFASAVQRCFPLGWWDVNRLNYMLNSELYKSLEDRKSNENDVLKSDKTVNGLNKQIADYKKFVKKCQADIGAVGRKLHGKYENDKNDISELESHLSKSTQVLKKVVDQHRSVHVLLSSCEGLFADGRFGDVVERVEGKHDDENKPQTPYELKLHLQAAAFDCLESLRKKLSALDKRIHTATAANASAESAFRAVHHKQQHASDLFRLYARDKFNAMLDGRELVARMQLKMSAATAESLKRREKSSLFGAYQQNLESTLAFISTLSEQLGVASSKSPDKRASMAQTRVGTPEVQSEHTRMAVGSLAQDLGISLVQRPSSVQSRARIKQLLLNNDDGDPTVILTAPMVVDEQEDAHLAEIVTECVAENTDVIDPARDSLLAEVDDSSSEDESQGSDDEEATVDVSLLFGKTLKRNLVSVSGEELDLPVEVLREMVFNEYWTLVGGLQSPPKKTDETASEVLAKMFTSTAKKMFFSKPRTQHQNKLVFSRSRLGIYKEAVDDSDDNDEVVEEQDIEEASIKRKSLMLTAKDESTGASAWRADATYVRLMSISMFQDPELERLDAHLERKDNPTKAVNKLSFSGSGLNFKNGDPFVLAGIARQKRVADTGHVSDDEFDLGMYIVDQETIGSKPGSSKSGSSKPGSSSVRIPSASKSDGAGSLPSSAPSISTKADHSLLGMEDGVVSLNSSLEGEFPHALLEEMASSSSTTNEVTEEKIRELLEKDAKVAEETVLVRPIIQEAKEVSQSTRNIMTKLANFKEVPVPLQSYIARRVRKMNPLRKSQSLTLQIAILAHQELLELDSDLMKGVSEMIESAPDYASSGGRERLKTLLNSVGLKEEDEERRVSLSGAIPDQNQNPLVPVEHAAHEVHGREFPTLKAVEPYRAKYMNLSVLVQAESKRITTSNPLFSPSRLGPDPPLLTDSLISQCLQNVQRKLEILADPVIPRPPKISRTENILALMSSRKKLKPMQMTTSSILTLESETMSKSLHSKVAIQLNPKALRPSPAFAPSVASRVKRKLVSASTFDAPLDAETIISGAHKDLFPRPVSPIKAADTKELYTQANASDLEDAEGLSALGLAYAAILNFNPIDDVSDPSECDEDVYPMMEGVEPAPEQISLPQLADSSSVSLRQDDERTEVIWHPTETPFAVLGTSLLGAVRKEPAVGTGDLFESLSEMSSFTDDEAAERDMEEQLRSLYHTVASQRSIETEVYRPQVRQKKSSVKQVHKIARGPVLSRSTSSIPLGRGTIKSL